MKQGKQFTKILALLLMMHAVLPLAAQLRVFTIGDSTVQDYNEGYSPRKGWGQMLQAFFVASGVAVSNKAVGGTSSMSFYNNQWAAVRDNLRQGDYVFIQFGINDRNTDPLRYAPAMTTFKEYIRKYVAETRAKGAIPVLVTTVRRNAWANGMPYDAYHDHPIAMRELATELSTPLVDLDERCRELMVGQGELYYTRHVTMNLVAGEYANYTSGAADNVHYQETGATDMARYVCDAIKASTNADMVKLAASLKPQFTVTVKVNDPSKAQTITRTTTYPEGIAMTMKTIPAAGAKFLRWENAAGVQVSSKPIYQFKMTDAATTYTAVYESNIVVPPATDITIDNASKTLIAPTAARYQWLFNNQLMAGATAGTIAVTSNGTYSVRLLDANGNILKTLSVCVSIGTDGTIRKIYLIGDSTVTTYKESQFPMTGWGQVLPYFFSQDIQIVNNAIGGRSSRSFRVEGRWKAIETALKPGDFVFIQFGHNDRDYSKPERYTSVADYTLYIDSFVVETRAKGAIPVLVSPMVMNAWNGAAMRNVFTETGNAYRDAMASVAKNRGAAFVDLNMKSFNFFKTLNANYCSRFYYNTYPAGEYPNYPNGLTDGTHFQENGALTLARWVVEGLAEIDDPFICPLLRYRKPLYTLTLNSDIANPGDMTKTASFPEGCPVTVKVLPSAGNTFKRWTQDNKAVATTTIHRFTMPAAATTLTAVFNGTALPPDCAGVSGGTATTDQCGQCTGGTTGKQACTPATIEAEDACALQGTIDANNAGFTGRGFANLTNVHGSSISFDIMSATSQTVSLLVRFTNGTTASRPCDVLVNNELQLAAVDFAPTGAWTTWTTQTLNLDLVAGINTIQFLSTTANGGPNFDNICFDDALGLRLVCPSTLSIALKKGWNLVSTNVRLPDSTIATLFGGLDVEEVKTMTAFWKKGQGDVLNSLKAITAGDGYFVKMNAEGTLTVVGIPVDTPVRASLQQNGWQLFGVPLQSATPFPTYFNATNCSEIKNFNGYWVPNGETNTLQDMEPGKGYLFTIKKQE